MNPQADVSTSAGVDGLVNLGVIQMTVVVSIKHSEPACVVHIKHTEMQGWHYKHVFNERRQ